MSVTRKRITPVSIAELPNRGNNNLPARPIEFERTPPQDLVAEQSVLGGMLLSKDAIADVVEIIICTYGSQRGLLRTYRSRPRNLASPR